MYFSKEDLEIIEKLDCPQKAIAVGLKLEIPKGIERLGENIRVCDMVKRARERAPFYADSDNHTCHAGWSVLGYGEPPPPFTSGEAASALMGYKTPEAGRRPYYYTHKLRKNSAKYVVFSTLDKLTFEPDLLLLCADAKQIHLLRAVVWSTGKVLESRVTLSMECSWYIAYPIITGEINHFLGSVGYATHRAGTWNPGEVAICIPWSAVPAFMENLREMPWTMPFYGPEGLEFKKKMLKRFEKVGIDQDTID
jgi:uncharacterized protein (DUF169 family)